MSADTGASVAESSAGAGCGAAVVRAPKILKRSADTGGSGFGSTGGGGSGAAPGCIRASEDQTAVPSPNECIIMWRRYWRIWRRKQRRRLQLRSGGRRGGNACNVTSPALYSRTKATAGEGLIASFEAGYLRNNAQTDSASLSWEAVLDTLRDWKRDRQYPARDSSMSVVSSRRSQRQRKQVDYTYNDYNSQILSAVRLVVHMSSLEDRSPENPSLLSLCHLSPPS